MFFPGNYQDNALVLKQARELGLEMPFVGGDGAFSDQLIKHFQDKVYAAVIPRNVRLAEAPSFGLAALRHDRSSRGAQAYLELAGEILRREQATTATPRP